MLAYNMEQINENSKPPPHEPPKKQDASKDYFSEWGLPPETLTPIESGEPPNEEAPDALKGAGPASTKEVKDSIEVAQNRADDDFELPDPLEQEAPPLTPPTSNTETTDQSTSPPPEQTQTPPTRTRNPKITLSAPLFTGKLGDKKLGPSVVTSMSGATNGASGGLSSPSVGAIPLGSGGAGGGGDGSGDSNEGNQTPVPQAPKRKSGMEPWVGQYLAGRLGEGGARTLGGLSRGLGEVIGAGAKAVGNIGAALNTAGAGQQALYGNAPGAAVGAMTQGIGNTLGVGAEALGNVGGDALEGFFNALGATSQDYANHLELQTLQDELYSALEEQVQKYNMTPQEAAIALKNAENNLGVLMNSFTRLRSDNAHLAQKRGVR
jgi:hypothetical protein